MTQAYAPPGTLARLLPELPRLVVDLLTVKAQLLPREPHPELAALGLAENTGLTRKGQKLLDHLTALADLLDLPLG